MTALSHGPPLICGTTFARLGAALVLVASIALVRPALAQDLGTEEARGAFTAGQAAYRAGHFAEALNYFQRAYDLTHESALLYNVALMNDRLRHDQEALDTYRRYLAENPEFEGRENVEARIAVLEDALRRVEPAPDDQAATAVDAADAGGAAGCRSPGRVDIEIVGDSPLPTSRETERRRQRVHRRSGHRAQPHEHPLDSEVDAHRAQRRSATEHLEVQRHEREQRGPNGVDPPSHPAHRG